MSPNNGSKQTTPVPQAKSPMLLAPFMMMKDGEVGEMQASALNGVKKPNMNDSHVKRARL